MHLSSATRGSPKLKSLAMTTRLAQANFDTAWLHAIARNYESAKKFASKSMELCSNGKDEFRLYLGCASVIRGWVMTLKGNENSD